MVNIVATIGGPMQSFGDLVQRPEPLSPEDPCGVAQARFEADPDLAMLAVADHGRPVGVLMRVPFLTRLAQVDHRETVGMVMEAAPTVIPVSLPAADAVAQLLTRAQNALPAGFVAVDGIGRYVGVGATRELVAAVGPAGLFGLNDASSQFCNVLLEPLTSLAATAQRLRGLPIADPRARDIELVIEGAEDALRLIGAINELSGARQGQLEVVTGPCRVADLMDEVDAAWRDVAQRRSLTLMVSYDGPPECTVQIDRARVMQMFDALIGHALAHAERGVVEASVRAELTGDGVRLACRVRDNGGRQDPAYLASLFGGPNAVGSVGGMRVHLGLALASRIVSAMGGALSAKSNAGPGVTIGFDILADTVTARSHEPAQPEPDAGRMAHVLVVEDNATNRMVIETLCEMIGCSSESVVDGVEAVEAARAGRFDVILMDIKMPRMDGLTATAEIRKLPGHAGAAPIIALTANADPEDMRRYLAAGMCRVVEKPIKADRFAEAISAALNGEPSASRHAAAA